MTINLDVVSRGTLATLIIGLVVWIYQTDRTESKEFQKSLLTEVRKLNINQTTIYSHLENNDAKLDAGESNIRQVTSELRRISENQLIYCSYMEREWEGHTCRR